MTRQRMHGPGMPAAIERQRRVDHRQPRSEQKDVGMRRHAVQRARLPRRGAVRRATRNRQAGARKITQRQHRGAGGHLDPVGELDPHSQRIGGKRDRFPADGEQRHAGRGACSSFGQGRFQVLAVSRARSEAVGRGATPTDEIVGAVRKRAHSRRRDVEEVPRFRRTVGDSAPDSARPIDDRDPAGALGLVKELDCDERAGGAASDDRDVHRTHAREGIHESEISRGTCQGGAALRTGFALLRRHTGTEC